MPGIHPRQQLRHAIRDHLAGQLPDEGYWTAAEDRVYAQRTIELEPDELPLILVTAREEEVEPVNSSDWDGGDRRTLQIHVECLALALDDVEDRLDALAMGVEQAMSGLLVDQLETAYFRLLRTDTDVDREGETPIGAARLTYQARYLASRLGVDFGLWDRDYPTNCPAPGITQITLRSYTPQGDLDSSYETVTFHGSQAHHPIDD
jgi:hypothetical protein